MVVKIKKIAPYIRAKGNFFEIPVSKSHKNSAVYKSEKEYF